MVQNLDKHTCTGCGACASICPKHCIEMVKDDFGYVYPEIRTKDSCVSCGLCDVVCPVIHPVMIKDRVKPLSFAAIHRDYEEWNRSASGGAFPAICRAWGDDETYVCGVRYSECGVAEHVIVKGVGGIKQFQKSKYVQSYTGTCFGQIKEILKGGGRVIFSGTPCQVAGLRSYLREEYDNLFCVDLICQGVGAPRVLSKYIRELSEKYKEEIIDFGFRYKRKIVLFRNSSIGRMEEYLCRLQFADGKDILVNHDLYNASFIQHLHCKDSCLRCPFKNLERIGDITIGDFKNRVMTFPRSKDIRTMSAVLVNTRKGLEILGDIKNYMEVFPVSMDVLTKNIVPLTKNVKENPNRKLFMADFLEGKQVVPAMKKYLRYPGLLMRVWGVLPEQVRYYVKSRILKK